MPADPDNAASSAGVSALPPSTTTAPAPERPRTAPPPDRVARPRIFTRLHLLVGALVLVAVSLGAWPALVALAVLLADVITGARAERAADRGAARFTAPDTPEVTVVRDGDHELVTPDELAPGDVVELEPGAPVVADGTVLAADGLELDESQVTGAALPVARRRGETVVAGSFVTDGRGRIEIRPAATRPGETGDEAPTSGRPSGVPPVRAGLDRLTPGLALVAGVLALVVVIARAGGGLGVADLRGPAVGLVALVPMGLVLLITVTNARTARDLHDQQVVVRDLAAVGGLAGVDVLCTDKTGTLTEPVLDVVRLELVGPAAEDAADLRRVLGAVAWSDPRPDVTSAALAAAFPPPGWTPTVVHPFSGGRRAAAIGFADHGHWLLGAPDVVFSAAGSTAETRAAGGLVDAAVRAGRRVLLLTRAHEPIPDGPLTNVPAGTPVAAVTFEERLRPDAAGTLAALRRRGVDIKVLSGDDTYAVAGVATRLDLPGSDTPVDGRRLPGTATDGAALATAVEDRTVFGRLDPEQKRAVVATLRNRGHRVAMIGDGSNDLPALEEADLGIVPSSGSPAARATAPVILAGSRLGPLVDLRDRGERLLGSVERLSDLFLTKTVIAGLLVLAVGAADTTAPLEPGHLVLVALLGLVAPAVTLVLHDPPILDDPPDDTPPSRRRRAGPGFVEQSLRCALPTGAVATAAAFASRTLAEDTVDTSSAGAATSATLTLFLVVLWLVVTLLRIASPETGASGRLPTWVTVPAGLAVSFAVVLFVPPLQSLFGLEVDGALALLSGVGVAAIAGVALEVAWQTSGWERPGRGV